MARLLRMALIVITVIIAVFSYSNKVSAFTKGLNCKDVLTQATLEVSPLMLRELCKDSMKSTIVVTSGNTEWQDEVYGFCTSFDLNIGSVKMNHTLPKRSLTIQLVKNDITLDAALVSNGGSSYQGSHLISVWGHQNTRFVLKIVPVCSNQLQALDVKPGLTDDILRKVTSGKRKKKAVATKPSRGIISPFGPLDLSPQFGSTVLSSLKNEGSDSQIHRTASGPNRLANVDYPRRKYRKILDIAKDLRLAATRNGSQNVSAYTTTDSVAKARLEWMEQKRLLFETKMEELRNYVSDEDLNDATNFAGVLDKQNHDDSSYLNTVDTSNRAEEVLEYKTTLKYTNNENKHIKQDYGMPRPNHKFVNKRDSSGTKKVRNIDEVAAASNPFSPKSSLRNLSPESNSKLASENFEQTEGTPNSNPSSLHSHSKTLITRSSAWIFFTQPPGNILASRNDFESKLSRQKASDSEKTDNMELSQTLKLTFVNQNESTKDINTVSKIDTEPIQGYVSYHSTKQPLFEFPDSPSMNVLKDLRSTIYVTKQYSSTDTDFLKNHSMDDVGYLVSPTHDLPIPGTGTRAVISTQPVLFSNLRGSLIYSDIHSGIVSFNPEMANMQPSSLFHPNAGDTFSSRTFSLKDSPWPAIHSTSTISLMSSALYPINGLTVPLSHDNAGSWSVFSNIPSSNAQESAVASTMTGKPNKSLARGIIPQQSTSSHFNINSTPPRWSTTLGAETEIVSREQPRTSISADTRQLSQINLNPSPIQKTSTIVTSLLSSSAIVNTGAFTWSSNTAANRDGSTLTPSFSEVSSGVKTSLRGSMATTEISETSEISSQHINPSKPFEFMMSSNIHTTLDSDRSTLEPRETNNDEDMSSDTLWPVVAALVVGIPSIIVFGIAIIVIHRRRLAQPAEASMISSSTLYPSI